MKELKELRNKSKALQQEEVLTSKLKQFSTKPSSSSLTKPVSPAAHDQLRQRL